MITFEFDEKHGPYCYRHTWGRNFLIKFWFESIKKSVCRKFEMFCDLLWMIKLKELRLLIYDTPWDSNQTFEINFWALKSVEPLKSTVKNVEFSLKYLKVCMHFST